MLRCCVYCSDAVFLLDGYVMRCDSSVPLHMVRSLSTVLNGSHRAPLSSWWTVTRHHGAGQVRSPTRQRVDSCSDCRQRCVLRSGQGSILSHSTVRPFVFDCCSNLGAQSSGYDTPRRKSSLLIGEDGYSWSATPKRLHRRKVLNGRPRPRSNVERCTCSRTCAARSRS
ncbi:hypothetical protein GY45DRAFT_404077 [Cubamyces sp. BRFM 1775]|nr:hypothetical protein GY45DRAFT_404077 [Cubamyces sp. BRFM 1775]